MSTTTCGASVPSFSVRCCVSKEHSTGYSPFAPRGKVEGVRLVMVEVAQAVNHSGTSKSGKYFLIIPGGRVAQGPKACKGGFPPGSSDTESTLRLSLRSAPPDNEHRKVQLERQQFGQLAANVSMLHQ